MIYRVVFSPEAEEQLAALYHYIAGAAAPDIAARYTESIVSYCESLQTFPHRGFKRDDVRPGLRITNYKKRAVIAFDVAAEQISILAPRFTLFITIRAPKRAKVRHCPSATPCLSTFGGLPPGETRSSHLRCCASLKEEWLFLRSRASHLAASRLAENEK